MPVSINTNKILGINANTSIIPPPSSGFEDTTSFALDGVDEFIESSVTFDPFTAHDDTTGIAKWTINLWVKFDSLPGTRYLYYISEPGGALVTYLYVNSTGRLQAFTAGTPNNWSRANGAVTTGNWYMISVVYDSTLGRYSRQKIYVNGAVPSPHQSNFQNGSYNASGNIHLGTNYAENAPIEGNINEPAIFMGYAATQAELAILYNSGAATNLNDHSTVPTHWWRSENAVWDNADPADEHYDLTDEMGTAKTLRTYNVDEADREADVPT